MVEDENEVPGEPVEEVKAVISYRVMILAALMTYHAPTRNITSIALKFIYGRMEDETWAQLGEQWKKAGGQGRLTSFYAARVLQTVRSNYCTHFSTPISLFRAVLILWVYSILAERCNGDGFLAPPPAPSVVLGPNSLRTMENVDWIEAGWNKVKLPGIGNLLCAQGRRKMLDESIMVMRFLKGWGISSTYSLLLGRLRANELDS